MSIDNISDYVHGMQDCSKGVPHKDGRSADYNRGYTWQYEWEQVKTRDSMRKDK